MEAPIFPTKKRWRPRFSLRALMFGMTVVCIAVGLLGVRIQRARLARIAIHQLQSQGADVRWVTEFGLLAGDPIPLPPDQHHHFIEIGEEWKGGNEGLKWLHHVNSLKRLEIHDAATIDDVGLGNIGKLADLEELTLARLPISDNGMSILQKTPNLKSLHLNRLPISDAGLHWLADLNKLEDVGLNFQRNISDQSVAALEHLPNLQRLVLARNGVTDAGLIHLNRRLVNLKLYDSLITNEGLKRLEPLTSLRFLDLSGAPVGDAGLHHLEEVPNLREVHLGRTFVTDAAEARLNQVLAQRASLAANKEQ